MAPLAWKVRDYAENARYRIQASPFRTPEKGLRSTRRESSSLRQVTSTIFPKHEMPVLVRLHAAATNHAAAIHEANNRREKLQPERSGALI
jgi:hypothetical protein